MAAVAPIQPVAWKPPYALGVALKNKTKQYKHHSQAKLVHIYIRLSLPTYNFIANLYKNASIQTIDFFCLQY